MIALYLLHTHLKWCGKPSPRRQRKKVLLKRCLGRKSIYSAGFESHCKRVLQHLWRCSRKFLDEVKHTGLYFSQRCSSDSCIFTAKWMAEFKAKVQLHTGSLSRHFREQRDVGARALQTPELTVCLHLPPLMTPTTSFPSVLKSPGTYLPPSRGGKVE